MVDPMLDHTKGHAVSTRHGDPHPMEWAVPSHSKVLWADVDVPEWDGRLVDREL
ncbi:MAG: hypothetical protein KDB14_02990 [Planctomycetales bacterium]|nr:hypothetical protein [Planctomycetales bacterium]